MPAQTMFLDMMTKQYLHLGLCLLLPALEADIISCISPTHTISTNVVYHSFYWLSWFIKLDSKAVVQVITQNLLRFMWQECLLIILFESRTFPISRFASCSSIHFTHYNFYIILALFLTTLLNNLIAELFILSLLQWALVLALFIGKSSPCGSRMAIGSVQYFTFHSHGNKRVFLTQMLHRNNGFLISWPIYVTGHSQTNHYNWNIAPRDEDGVIFSESILVVWGQGGYC